MSYWETMEEVEKDLFEYSHLEYPGNAPTAAPPKSIAEYRARTQSSRNPGLFDEEPEMKEIFISGRGKHHPGHIIRPGEPVMSTPEEDMDIRRKIREVSGLGYSNEIIEKMYGQQAESTASDEEDPDDGIILPNLKLRPYKPTENEKIGSPSKAFKKVSEKSPEHSGKTNIPKKGTKKNWKVEMKETMEKAIEEIDKEGELNDSSSQS